MILDGHNDLVQRALDGARPVHIDLAAAADVDWAGGFFALGGPFPSLDLPATPTFALPLFEPLDPDEARAAVEQMANALEALDVTIVRRRSDIVSGRVNAIMHLEGAEPLAPDLSDLDAWYERGLRSIGITWARPNAFGEGVPFRYPSSPDTGAGLTAAGRDLVHACNLMGILVDLSHLNEAGFWDAARITQAPLVATHSNAHELSPFSRNLTDRQLAAIGDSGGVVGVTFGTAFLVSEGVAPDQVTLADIVRQVDYIAGRIGIDHVAFGSDFEGAELPADLDGIAGMPRLVEAIRAAGFGEEEIAKITHGNWLRVLEDTWRPWSRYFRSAGFDARPTLLDAVARFSAPGLAVDLGAGTGRDTLELLRRGWRVCSIDLESEAVDRIVELAGADAERLEARVGRYESIDWPRCDLLNASFSLPFCAAPEFPAVWERIHESLRPGGRFCGQLFGVDDEWARTGLLVYTRGEVEQLLAPYEIESLSEFAGEGPTTIGKTKRWHVFHVVARKR
jgi:membrane dipeptidase